MTVTATIPQQGSDEDMGVHAADFRSDDDFASIELNAEHDN